MNTATLDNATDLELIQHGQKGDSTAIKKLCQKYEPLIKKYAHASHVETMSEDVEAELWILFLEAIPNYDATKGIPVAGYFQSTIKYGQWNLFKKQRKQWQREQGIGELDSSSKQENKENQFLDKVFISPENIEEDFLARLTQAAQYQKLKKALSSLSPKEKELILHHYYYKESLTQIANAKGYTRQAIQYQHKQILKKMAKLGK